VRFCTVADPSSCTLKAVIMPKVYDNPLTPSRINVLFLAARPIEVEFFDSIDAAFFTPFSIDFDTIASSSLFLWLLLKYYIFTILFLFQ
jgi:hypothetical protein